MIISTASLDIINKSILYDHVDREAFPMESTGCIFRGVGEKELKFIQEHGYIASKGKGNDADQDNVTCFSQLYSQAEGYARSGYDLYNEKQAYVLALMPPANAYENDLGEIEAQGKIPANNIVAVIQVDQLQKAINRKDAKGVHKELPEGGAWKTMNGHHIYVLNGKVLAGAVPGMKGAKKATKAQLAEYQSNLDKKAKKPATKASSTTAKKPAAKKAAPPKKAAPKATTTTPKATKPLTKKQLFSAIDKTKPYQKYKPTESVVDWGNGKARGQGKRVGKLVMGGMGDAPTGKKAYVNLVGNVPEYEANKTEFGGMSDRDKLDYLKAREYGLNHEQAMVYQLANSDKYKDLTDKQVMDRIDHYADKPAAKTAAPKAKATAKKEPAAKTAAPKAKAKPAAPKVKAKPPTKAEKVKQEAAAARKAIDDIANSRPKEAKKKEVLPKDNKKNVEEALKGANNKGTKTKPGKAATKADLDKVAKENAEAKKRQPKAATKEDLDEMFGTSSTTKKPAAKPKAKANQAKNAAGKANQSKGKNGVDDIRSDKQENHNVAYDVGKKVGGAKKDQAALRAATDKLMSDSTGQSLDNLENMAPELAQKHCVKKNLLNPVDFEADCKRGVDVNVAMCKQLIYDRVATKPAGDTAEDRQKYLNAIRSLERALEPVENWGQLREAVDTLGNHMRKETPKYLQEQMHSLDYAKREAAREPRDHELRKYNRDGTQDPITREEWKKSKADRVKNVEKYIEDHKEAAAKPYAPLGEKLTNFFTNYDSRDRTMKTIGAKKLTWDKYFDMEKIKAAAPKKESATKVKWEREMPAEIRRSGGRATPVKKPEDMVKNFNFSGVEFGNWLDDKSGNFHLVKCAEAFQDLADILGLKDKDVSFNGRLSMAFGARGSGSALAHYEPESKVINITKNGGAGSLAHEWGHAMDNMMYQESTGRSSMHLASEGMEDKGTPEIREAYKGLMDAIIHGDGSGRRMVENKHNSYYRYPSNYKKAYDELGLDEGIKKLSKHISDEAAMRKKYYESLRGRYDDVTLDKKISQAEAKALRDKREMVQVMAFVHERATGEKLEQIPMYTGNSQYYENSAQMGNTKYWTSNAELFARAFESSIEDKMRNGKVKNDYLVHGTYYPESLPVPYPTGKEREKINKCFDTLMEAIRNSGAIQKALLIEALDEANIEKGIGKNIFIGIDQANRNAYRVPDTEGVIWIPINRLSTPYQTDKALNFDKIQENVEKMRAGENIDPVIIGFDYDIHDGHHRVEASKIMKYTHVPCIVGGANELQVQRAQENYRELWKSVSKDLPPGGEWKTVKGRHVYIKDGKVLAGAIPGASPAAKKTAKPAAKKTDKKASSVTKKTAKPAAKPAAKASSVKKKPAAKKTKAVNKNEKPLYSNSKRGNTDTSPQNKKDVSNMEKKGVIKNEKINKPTSKPTSKPGRAIRGNTTKNSPNGEGSNRGNDTKRMDQGTSRSSSKSTYVKYNEIKDSKAFHSAISKAKANNDHGAFVDLHEAADYKHDKLLMSPAGGAGVAIEPNGNIVSVFKDPTSTEKGAMHSILLNSLEHGGKKLDCFDGGLPSMYAKYGMIPVAKVKFDKEYAPEGWNFKRDGEPDVVFMAHNGDSVDKVRENYGKYPPVDLSKVPYADSYDEGQAMQSKWIEDHNKKPTPPKPGKKKVGGPKASTTKKQDYSKLSHDELRVKVRALEDKHKEEAEKMYGPKLKELKIKEAQAKADLKEVKNSRKSKKREAEDDRLSHEINDIMSSQRAVRSDISNHEQKYRDSSLYKEYRKRMEARQRESDGNLLPEEEEALNAKLNAKPFDPNKEEELYHRYNNGSGYDKRAVKGIPVDLGNGIDGFITHTEDKEQFHVYTAKGGQLVTYHSPMGSEKEKSVKDIARQAANIAKLALSKRPADNVAAIVNNQIKANGISPRYDGYGKVKESKKSSKPKVDKDEPNPYHIFKRAVGDDEAGYAPVKGGKKIDIGHGVDAFYHKRGPNDYAITEATSGLLIASGKTLKEATDKAKNGITDNNIERVKNMIKRHVETNGSSPKYSK